MGAALCVREGNENYEPAPLRAVMDRNGAHDALVALAKRRAADDVAMLEPLLVAESTRAYEVLGLASMQEYCGRLFGWGGRQTRERLRVAKALRALPEIRERWARGELSYSVVRELTRVATPTVEEDWVHWAIADGRRRTGHEVQKMVMRYRPGALPTDAPAPFEEQRVRVVLEMSGSEASRLSEVRAEAARRLGHGADDETLAKMLFDAFLRVGGSSEEEGRAPHQVRMNVCERCGATERQAGGEGLVPVEPIIGEVALCDAQVLREGERASQTVPPSVRREVLARDEGKCAAPGCRNAAFVDVHHIDRRAEGGGHEPDNLVTLCTVHHDAVHRGRLVVRRSDDGPRFERGDGDTHGAMNAGDTERCSRAAKHFEMLVEATGSERLAREALDAKLGQAPGGDSESGEVVAPRSQPESGHGRPLRPRSS